MFRKGRGALFIIQQWPQWPPSLSELLPLCWLGWDTLRSRFPQTQYAHTNIHTHVHSHQHTKSTNFVRDPTTQTPTKARRAAAANKRKVWLRRNSREISLDQKLADQFHPRTHLLHGRTAPQLLRTGSGHRWAPLRNSFSLIFTHFSAIGAPTVGSLLAGAFFLRTLLQSSSSGAFRIKHGGGGEICLYFSTWWW